MSLHHVDTKHTVKFCIDTFLNICKKVAFVRAFNFDVYQPLVILPTYCNITFNFQLLDIVYKTNNLKAKAG